MTVESISMVTTAASALTVAESTSDQHRSKWSFSISKKGLLVAVGFTVVTGILVALFCRHEQRASALKASPNVEKTDLSALEDKWEARILEQSDRISKLEKEDKKKSERITQLETKVEKCEGKYQEAAVTLQLHVRDEVILFNQSIVIFILVPTPYFGAFHL